VLIIVDILSMKDEEEAEERTGMLLSRFIADYRGHSVDER